MDNSKRNSTYYGRCLRGIRLCAAGILLFIVSVAILWPQSQKLDQSAFSVDEPGWIAASYYYTNLVAHGDFDWEHWNCEQCGSGASYGSLNMHLGEWLMMIPLQLDPQTRNQNFSSYYDVDRTWQQNLQARQIPPDDVLLRGRSAPVIFGALCCLLVFIIGNWVYNVWVGLLASALVLFNPIVMKLSGQAMTDTFYNFFLLACCLAFIALYKSSNYRRALVMISAAGILTGLACSVKVTGMVVGTTFFLVAGGYRFYTERWSLGRVAVSTSVFILSAFAVVYLLNPLFWPSFREIQPQKVMAEVHNLTADFKASHKLPWHEREAFLADNRYPQLKNLSHPMEFPMLFLRWKNMMERQKSRGWQGWTGPRWLSLNETLAQLLTPFGRASVVVPLATALCLLAGIFFLVSKATSPASGRDNSHLVPLMAFLVNYSFILLFMSLNWDRYYLPTLMSGELIVAVGLVSATASGLRFNMQRRVSPARKADYPATQPTAYRDNKAAG